MFIPTPGKSPLKTGDRRSVHGLRLLVGVPEGTEGLLVGAVVALVMELIMTALYGITLLALAEAIYVFLDIEENTREIARRIRELPGVTAPPVGMAQ